VIEVRWRRLERANPNNTDSLQYFLAADIFACKPEMTEASNHAPLRIKEQL
jgi:hypothetical protein